MARTRPKGRTKSDHRVCQAERHARAANYRERIAISAEKQEALIAAVNMRCEAEPAPHRRRGQKSKGARAACGPSPVRPCRSSTSAEKSAKRHLARTLGAPTAKDPHSLYCHQCNAIAEFGHRGSKEGGKERYFCSAHVASSGCFCIDKDRAVWVRDRLQARRLKAEVARLEEELRQMDEASSSAGPAHIACSLPVWMEANFKVALPHTKPMSHALLAILLMIGCVESNPGPSSDGVGSGDSASASVLPSLQTRLSAGAPVESGGGELSMEDSRMKAAAEKGTPGQAIGDPSAQAESGAGDEDSSTSDASEVDLEIKQDWDYEEEEPEEPTSKDLDFLHDSESQEAVNPVVEYAQMNKEMDESDDELPPLVVKRRKRQDVAHSPFRRLRSRVNGPGSSSAGGASSCDSSQLAASEGGRAGLADGGQSANKDPATRDDVAMEDQEAEEVLEASGVGQNWTTPAPAVGEESVGGLLKHTTTRLYGQQWFKSRESPSGRGPRDLAVAWKHLHGHAILVASDVAPNSGVKMYTSFKDVPALVAYCNRLSARGQHLYECLLEEAPSLIYLDLDYYVPLTASADAGDYEEAVRARDAEFAERKRHFDRLRDGFLEAVLGVPKEAVRFEESTAHGAVPGGFKYSVHAVLKGFYLEDSRARSLFAKAFDHFQKNPPPCLARSAEFVWTEDQRGRPKLIWDGTVYSKFQCWRMLRSRKNGSDRFLEPSEGSSDLVADHLAGLYSTTDLQRCAMLDEAHLEKYLEQHAPTLLRPPRPTMRVRDADPQEDGGRNRADLGEQEQRVLVECYQQEHPGATVARDHVVAPGVFTLHFDVPEPTCLLAGRPHTSPGNNNTYLLYRRSRPGVVLYKCHSSSCSGTARLLHLETGQITGWTEDYVKADGMLPYPVFPIDSPAKHTILTSANKGIGKSKEGFDWLERLLEIYPHASVAVIAANVTLSRKYDEDLKQRGIEVTLYLDLPGKITASRVVCCVNSLPRLDASFDVVIMDEMDMIMSNMNSDVMARKKMVFLALEGATKHAKIVLGMDANIGSPRVMQWLYMVRTDAALHAIRNRGVYPGERKATIKYIPSTKRFQADPYGPAIAETMEALDRGKKVIAPSASKTYVLKLKEAFEQRYPSDSPTAKSGKFLYSKPESEAAKEALVLAVTDPDTHLTADLCASSPVIGPGISRERPHFDKLIAFAMNAFERGPTVETFLRQLFRDRTVSDFTIYVKGGAGPRSLPSTVEDVFCAIEDEDRELAKLLGSTEHLDFMLAPSGTRPICDRNSPSCILYANNILTIANSFRDYPELLRADLIKQGFVVEEGYLDDEAPSIAVRKATNGDKNLADEDWRAKYVVDEEAYRKLLRKAEVDSLNEMEERQRHIYECIRNVHKVDPRRVDHNYEVVHCGKELVPFKNYIRFRTTPISSLMDELTRALKEGDTQGVTKEYVAAKGDMSRRVPFAVMVLAASLDCQPEEVERPKEDGFAVEEDALLAVHDALLGPTPERLAFVREFYGFVQTAERETATTKRNAIKKVLHIGLGLGHIAPKKSNGKFQAGRPHIFKPLLWQEVRETYGRFADYVATLPVEGCEIRPRQ